MIISTGMSEINPRTKRRYKNNEINLRWREEIDGKWVRQEKTVTDFHPYLFLNPKNFYRKSRGKSGHTVRRVIRAAPDIRKAITEEIHDVEFEFKDENGKHYHDAEGNLLYKVVFPYPGALYRYRRLFGPSYEGDVPYEDRFAIDNIDEMKPYKMRKLFVDLEALQYRKDDMAEGVEYEQQWNRKINQEICVIGAYDNYSETYTIWAQHKNLEQIDYAKVYDDEHPVIIKQFFDEFGLLTDFVDYVDDIDPDVLLAWAAGFYDWPSLYYRLRVHGLEHHLSPSSLGKNRYMKAPDYKGNEYRAFEKSQDQPINGRITICLKNLFQRIHKDSKSADLPSGKLDLVGQTLFGRGKTEFRPDFYDKDYDVFIDDYLYYNYRDVQLMVDIDRDFNLIEGQQKLQELGMCRYASTLSGSAYARVYFMRKADFKQRSGMGFGIELAEELKWKIIGAIVLDPEELNTVGLHKNVAILDFAGLYPSMMEAYNTSWETKVTDGSERDDDIVGDNCRFRREPLGVLPLCVNELNVLRDEYKRLRQEATDSNEIRKWDDAQKTVKRLRASFYGLMGFQRFGWADKDIARTITYGGRTALKDIMAESERLGYKVLYGHTDSIFLSMGDDLSVKECVDKAKELSAHLTEMVQSTLKTKAVEVDLEAVMDRFYLPRRNRYGGRLVWDDKYGFEIANRDITNRMKIQGLEYKHTNSSPISREIQFTCLNMIWDEAEHSEVIDYVKGVITSVRQGEYPREKLYRRGKLGKWLHAKPYGYPHHPLYHLAGTNPNSSPDAEHEEDECYGNLTDRAKAAAWYNLVIADEYNPPIDKGEQLYMTLALDGPTWIPSGGYIGFQEYEQISDYTLDIEKIIVKEVVGKIEHLMYGIGMDNMSLLKPEKRVFTIEGL